MVTKQADHVSHPRRLLLLLVWLLSPCWSQHTSQEGLLLLLVVVLLLQLIQNSTYNPTSPIQQLCQHCRVYLPGHQPPCRTNSPSHRLKPASKPPLKPTNAATHYPTTITYSSTAHSRPEPRQSLVWALAARPTTHTATPRHFPSHLTSAHYLLLLLVLLLTQPTTTESHCV
jgi:hypothetical protein